MTVKHEDHSFFKFLKFVEYNRRNQILQINLITYLLKLALRPRTKILFFIGNFRNRNDRGMRLLVFQTIIFAKQICVAELFLSF